MVTAGLPGSRWWCRGQETRGKAGHLGSGCLASWALFGDICAYVTPGSSDSVAYPASHARTGSYPPQTRTRTRNRRERQAGQRWPLLVILGAQAVITLTLIARPVVQDEATYVDAGN